MEDFESRLCAQTQYLYIIKTFDMSQWNPINFSFTFIHPFRDGVLSFFFEKRSILHENDHEKTKNETSVFKKYIVSLTTILCKWSLIFFYKNDRF